MIGALILNGPSTQCDINTGSSSIDSLHLSDADTVNVSAGRLGTIWAADWAGGKLVADTIASLSVARTLNIDLTVTNVSQSSAAVGNIKVAGAIGGGHWNVQGLVKSVAAGSISGLNATAMQVGSIAARLDVRQTELTLLEPAGAAQAVGRLTVGGELAGCTIRTSGSIGSVTVGAMRDSNLLAGVALSYNRDANGDGVFDLPAAADFIDAATPAEISSFTITGGRALAGALFANSTDRGGSAWERLSSPGAVGQFRPIFRAGGQ